MKTEDKITKVILQSNFTPDDEIAALFWNFDPDGIEIDEHGVVLYYGSDKNPNLDAIKHYAHKLNLGFTSLLSEEIVAKNWNEEWEKSINITKVGKNFVIKPTFREYAPEPDDIVLIIEPKMSFGTGEHETTRLMLQAIEELVKPGMKVLDAGTGTGILAIAAAKLGASEVQAFDIDEWTADNGSENVMLNKVSDIVEVRVCEIKDIIDRDFDLTMANIHKSVLMEISDELVKTVKPKGLLVLSGILPEDEYEILRKYEAHGLMCISTLKENEWIALTFTKL